MSETKENPYQKFKKEQPDYGEEVKNSNKPIESESTNTTKTNRRRREKTENATYTLTPTHKEKLAKYAEKEGVSASQILREWIEDFC